MKAVINQKGHGPHHMILAHGFLGLPSEWDFLIEKLSDIYTFHLLTLPGHDKAPIDKDLDQFFDSLNSYVEKFPEYSLLGYSMGGRILLEFALRNLGSIRHFVLESSNPGINDQKERERRYKRDLLGFEGQSFEEFLKKWYRQSLFHPQLDYRISEKSKVHQPQLLEKSMALFSPGARPSLWNELNRLNHIPCHFISGTQDNKYFQIGTDLETIGWNHHSLETYHNVHLEQPNDYWKIIKKLGQS